MLKRVRKAKTRQHQTQTHINEHPHFPSHQTPSLPPPLRIPARTQMAPRQDPHPTTIPIRDRHTPVRS